MLSYVIRRLAATSLVLLVVSFLVFSMTRLLPGDPARLMAGAMADEAVIEAMRQDLGLDQSLFDQYRRYMMNLVQGDLGDSIRTRAPVSDEILSRLPATIELAVAATLMAAAIGITLGVLAASFRDRFVDRTVQVVSIGGMSIPHFWLGLMLLTYLAGVLGLFPIGGRGTPSQLLLPAITLAARPIALVTRLTRASMIETFHEGYIKTAQAKGLSRTRVLLRHALRNAMLPTITVLGLQFGVLLGGVIIVETVFVWPGLGRLLIGAIASRDFPVIQGIVLLLASTFALVNLAVDLLYGWLDPRIQYAHSR